MFYFAVVTSNSAASEGAVENAAAPELPPARASTDVSTSVTPSYSLSDSSFSAPSLLSSSTSCQASVTNSTGGASALPIPSTSSASFTGHRRRAQAEYTACRERQGTFHDLRMKLAEQEHEWARERQEWARKRQEWALEEHQQLLQLFSFQKNVHTQWLQSARDMQQQQLDAAEETFRHVKEVVDRLPGHFDKPGQT